MEGMNLASESSKDARLVLILPVSVPSAELSSPGRQEGLYLAFPSQKIRASPAWISWGMSRKWESNESCLNLYWFGNRCSEPHATKSFEKSPHLVSLHGLVSLTMQWWRTGTPGMLQCMGLQRIRQDWETEQCLLSLVFLPHSENQVRMYTPGALSELWLDLELHRLGQLCEIQRATEQMLGNAGSGECRLGSAPLLLATSRLQQ